jgi:hypothetical protein
MCPSLLFLAALSLPVSLSAQVFTRSFDNAAALALGGAVIAFPTAEAGFDNEAAAGALSRWRVAAGSALPYSLPLWRAAYFDAGIPLDGRSAAMVEFSASGIDVYREQRLRAAYARRLGEQSFAAVGVSVLHLAAPEYGSATGATASAAALVRVLPGVWLGARIDNPVAQVLSGAALPTGLRAGACWQLSPAVRVLGEIDKTLGRRTDVKAGVDYRPVPSVAIRAGYRAGPGAMSFGAGWRLRSGLLLDAASEWHAVLGFTPALRVGWEGQGVK